MSKDYEVKAIRYGFRILPKIRDLLYLQPDMTAKIHRFLGDVDPTEYGISLLSQRAQNAP